MLLCTVVACGDDEPKTCDPVAQTGCEQGTVCEFVTGAEPACFAPVIVQGRVFDLGDDADIAGARVAALDINGAPISSVAVSADDGSYELAIPSERHPDDGTPMAVELTLRSDAAGFQTFPGGLRRALPIDTASAMDVDGVLVVQSSRSDIGLIALAGGEATGTIVGTVETPTAGAGVLVVAEAASGAGYATIANRAGDYVIFNVPPGSYEVLAYAKGANYDVVTGDVTADSETEVNLSLNAEPPGTVSGEVQIVNAPGGAATSVILVVESTFQENAARGQTVPGLRDPVPGTAPSITGSYTISDVPAGRYVVLAAFEDDMLVRDPDVSIGGTSTLHIEVMSGATTTVEGFKVTEALAVTGPGANGPEEVTGMPMLRWSDDSSEDEYTVEVFDSFGERVWMTTISGTTSDPSVAYDGPSLVSGMYYQFRATSMKNGTPLSRTEDLKGVFYAP